MKKSDLYLKIVEWSEKDQCYVGTCPGLFYGGCHGDNEAEVYKELCKVVDENIALYKKRYWKAISKAVSTTSPMSGCCEIYLWIKSF